MTAQPVIKKKRSLLINIIFILAAICCICLAASTTMRSLGLLPTDTPGANIDTPHPIETQPSLPPTATLMPVDELRARIAESLGTSNRGVPRLTEYNWSETDKSLIVIWAIDDNITSEFIMIGVQTDMTDMLKIISQSNLLPDYQYVTFIGTFPLSDAFGNISEENVVTSSFNKSTVDKINWDNFLYTNIFTIADLKNIHPAMLE